MITIYGCSTRPPENRGFRKATFMNLGFRKATFMNLGFRKATFLKSRGAQRPPGGAPGG